MKIMSEYEHINEATKKQAKVQRQAAVRFCAILVGKGVAAVGVCWVLNHFGCISNGFFATLAASIAMYTAFMCGVVCGQ